MISVSQHFSQTLSGCKQKWEWRYFTVFFFHFFDGSCYRHNDFTICSSEFDKQVKKNKGSKIAPCGMPLDSSTVLSTARWPQCIIWKVVDYLTQYTNTRTFHQRCSVRKKNAACLQTVERRRAVAWWESIRPEWTDKASRSTPFLRTPHTSDGH